MAKEKKRGFFSWLGFGEKEQETEQKTEEQQAVEEPSQPETPVETAAVVDAEETVHSKEEVETFAEEVVEVTEQVQESEKPEPVVVEAAIEAVLYAQIRLINRTAIVTFDIKAWLNREVFIEFVLVANRFFMAVADKVGERLIGIIPA